MTQHPINNSVDFDVLFENFKTLRCNDYPVEDLNYLHSHPELFEAKILNFVEDFIKKDTLEILEEDDRLLVAVYTLGVYRSKAACSLILDLLKMDKQDEFGLFGEILTESLPQIIAACYDGNAAALKDFISASDIHMFARHACVEALFYLAAVDEMAMDTVEALLVEMINPLLALDPQPDTEDRGLLLCLVYDLAAFSLDKAEAIIAKNPWMLEEDEFFFDLQAEFETIREEFAKNKAEYFTVIKIDYVESFQKILKDGILTDQAWVGEGGEDEDDEDADER